jgi:hypothetical protein
MDNIQTDPKISTTMTTALWNWKFEDNKMLPIDLSLTLAAQQQSNIGWHLLIEGWVSFEWEEVQSLY